MNNINKYIQGRLEYEVLSDEENLELIRKYKEENDIRSKEKVWLHNFRLVLKVCNGIKCNEETYKDIISEGDIALGNCIEHFEINKGYKFSTYAINSIRNGVYRYLYKNEKMTKVCESHLRDIKKMNNIEYDYLCKYGIECSNEEISSLLNKDIEYINKLKYIRDGRKEISLDYTYDDGETLAEKLGKNMLDNNSAREILINEMINLVHKGLSNLNDREREFICKNYGIGCKKESMEEIGNEYGISKQRVSVIINGGINKLKDNNDMKNANDIRKEVEVL